MENKTGCETWDPKNGIAVNAHQIQHAVDWDGAKMKTSVSGEENHRSIHIQLSEGTMNLDNGLQLPTMWNPILNLSIITLFCYITVTCIMLELK